MGFSIMLLVDFLIILQISGFMQQNNNQVPMFKAVLLFLTISTCLAFKECEPFGTRLFYGEVAHNKGADQKLVIQFNTKLNCEKSYLLVLKKTGLDKIQCTTTSLHLSAKVNNYETSIHRCSISGINFEETFHYNAFGWDGTSSNPIAFAQDFISVKIADITDAQRKINLIILADWSPLEKNLGKYTPLDHLFSSTLKEKEINGIVVIGDVGYDLDSNNCTNYEKFLVMLSANARSVPVIMITGNHEYNTQDNFQLFKSSFQMHNLDTQLATYLEIGALSLLPFDTFQILLGSKPAKDPCIDKFKQLLSGSRNSQRFVVPISHYPLACSGTSKNCKNDRVQMKSYWQSMLDAQVSLYLGAHYHTYQRIHPYQRDNTFIKVQGDYKTHQKYLVSIVEGVAGNDKDIVESIDKIEDFTASYTVNETGFGVLTVDSSEVVYSHYSTKRGLTDKMRIIRSKPAYNLRSQ